MVNSKWKAYFKEQRSIFFISLKFLLCSMKKESRPIFIVGSGRSGTHFLARTLIEAEEISDVTNGNENPAVFFRVTRSALGQRQDYSKVVSTYRKLLTICNTEFFLDQSHPNIWHVEKLRKSFPDAVFIGITRRPESVIYSMLNHSGTADWTNRWKEFPIPNKFLGITDSSLASYNDMDFIQRSAVRWKAHYERMKYLEESFPGFFLHIDYDYLAKSPEACLSDIAGFIGLKSKIPSPEVKIESLNKWQGLSEKQIAKIREIAGGYYE